MMVNFWYCFLNGIMKALWSVYILSWLVLLTSWPLSLSSGLVLLRLLLLDVVVVSLLFLVAFFLLLFLVHCGSYCCSWHVLLLLLLLKLLLLFHGNRINVHAASNKRGSHQLNENGTYKEYLIPVPWLCSRMLGPQFAKVPFPQVPWFFLNPWGYPPAITTVLVWEVQYYEAGDLTSQINLVRPWPTTPGVSFPQAFPQSNTLRIRRCLSSTSEVEPRTHRLAHPAFR